MLNLKLSYYKFTTFFQVWSQELESLGSKIQVPFVSDQTLLQNEALITVCH